MFTSLVSKCMEPWHCVPTSDGTLFMYSHPTIPCGSLWDTVHNLLTSVNGWCHFFSGSPSAVWSRMAITCGSMIIVLVFAPACIMFRVDDTNKSAIDMKIRYGWLYLRYEDGFEGWELIVMARKIYFIAIGVLVQSKKAVWAQYFVATVFALVMQVAFRPMAGRNTSEDHGNWTETLMLAVQSITIGLGGIFVFGNDSPVVAIVLIVINFMTLIPTVLLVLRSSKRSCCAKQTPDLELSMTL
jgi:hypothetical protein